METKKYYGVKKDKEFPSYISEFFRLIPKSSKNGRTSSSRQSTVCWLWFVCSLLFFRR